MDQHDNTASSVSEARRVTSLLKQAACQLLQKSLQAAGGGQQAPGQALELLPEQFAYPPELALGHISLPCHSFAKIFRKSPQEIAQTFVRALEHQGLEPYFQKVEAVGGFVNFFVHFAFLMKVLLDSSSESLTSELLVPESLVNALSLEPKSPVHLGRCVMIEFAQLNTHKLYHVGHLRNILLGDALARLRQAAGDQVIRAVYPGDLGTHIAKVIWYLRHTSQSAPPAGVDPATWLGEQYAAADAFLKMHPEVASFKAQIGGVLRQLESRSGPDYQFFLTTRGWSLARLQEILTWLGIAVDCWYYESECEEAGRKLVDQKLAEGLLAESEGAIGLDLSAAGLGFAMVLKSDRTSLYLTKDLELIRKKFHDYPLDLSVVVVDTRQSLHFKQAFMLAERLGLRPAQDSLHLAYETVTDEAGVPCSSREQTGMRLEVLQTQLKSAITEQYLERYRGVWPDEEIEQTAGQVALGALKYGFLKVDSLRLIRFVLADWMKLEGDTGPYLQYVHARCQGILKKVAPAERPKSAPEWVLATAWDQELLLWLERFPGAVGYAAQEWKPSWLCSYLYDLAKVFNRFYKECPIKNASEPGVQATRLQLVQCVASTLREGLALLGIPAPARL